jgi:hypothetical protein
MMLDFPLLGLNGGNLSSGGELVALSDLLILKAVVSPADAKAGVNFLNTGGMQKVINTTVTSIGGWLTPPRTVTTGQYELRATLSSGDAVTSGTVGSWLDLDTNRSWYNEVTTTGETISALLFEIRDAVTLIVLASATITLHAEVVV